MSAERCTPRQRSRRAALQVLYAIDLAARARSGTPPSTEEVFDRVAANFDLPEGGRAFAKELVCGAVSRGSEIDALLSAHAEHWRLSRMAVVDRSILRLATYELTGTDTPVSVILDEAIELARRFGAEASPAFVNGVLDAVAARVRTPGAAGPSA